jgi:hypothetical protein
VVLAGPQEFPGGHEVAAERMGTGRWRPWAVHQTCVGSRFSRLLFLKSDARGARPRVVPHRPRAGPKRPAGHLLPRPHDCREPHRTVVSGEPRPRGTGQSRLATPSGCWVWRKPRARTCGMKTRTTVPDRRPLSVWVRRNSPRPTPRARQMFSCPRRRGERRTCRRYSMPG